MAKLTLDEVTESLTRVQIKNEEKDKIIEDLRLYLESLKQEREPKSKNQFFILLNDENNELAGKSFEGWVGTIPEGDNMALVISRVQDAAKNYNANTKNGAKNPIKTIGEAFAICKRKFFREQNVTPKVKESVQVILTNNKIV